MSTVVENTGKPTDPCRRVSYPGRGRGTCWGQVLWGEYSCAGNILWSVFRSNICGEGKEAGTGRGGSCFNNGFNQACKGTLNLRWPFRVGTGDMTSCKEVLFSWVLFLKRGLVAFLLAGETFFGPERPSRGAHRGHHEVIPWQSLGGN